MSDAAAGLQSVGFAGNFIYTAFSRRVLYIVRHSDGATKRRGEAVIIQLRLDFVSKAVRLRFDRRSIPIGLQFDCVTTIRRWYDRMQL